MKVVYIIFVKIRIVLPPCKLAMSALEAGEIFLYIYLFAILQISTKDEIQFGRFMHLLFLTWSVHFLMVCPH
jgi:hypothetical protein